MSVATVFLNDRYISSFRLVFVDARQEDRGICQAMVLSRMLDYLSMRIAILRYKADGLSGGG